MKSSQNRTPRTFGSDNAASTVRYDVSLLTDQDLHLFNEGSHDRLYQKLGAHPLQVRETREPTLLPGRRTPNRCV